MLVNAPRAAPGRPSQEEVDGNGGWQHEEVQGSWIYKPGIWVSRHGADLPPICSSHDVAEINMDDQSEGYSATYLSTTKDNSLDWPKLELRLPDKCRVELLVVLCWVYFWCLWHEVPMKCLNSRSVELWRMHLVRNSSFRLYRSICVSDSVATAWPSLAHAYAFMKIVCDRV